MECKYVIPTVVRNSNRLVIEEGKPKKKYVGIPYRNFINGKKL